MKQSLSTTPYLNQPGTLERPRYYPRQLMTPSELILEQDYFRDKLRRHNRLLHGYGVVCGAWVSRLPLEASPGKPGCDSNGNGNGKGKAKNDSPKEALCDPWKVKVSSGYLLGPCGDEIVIACEQVVDVRTYCQEAPSSDACSPGPDPWCTDVFIERPSGPVFVAVRYKEILARPVRVQPLGCGCDDSACEYSRWQDGFEICMLTECPPSHQVERKGLDICDPDLLCACPPCPDDPWVVLARVELDPSGIRSIDNTSCRRMVISFATTACPPVRDVSTEDPEARKERIRTARKEIAARVDIKEEDLMEIKDMLAVPATPAVNLAAVQPESRLGKKLAAEGWTIADVGRMPEATFVKLVSTGVPKNQLKTFQEQSRTVWKNGAEVVRLVDELSAEGQRAGEHVG